MPAFALISSRSQARRCGACWCSESCSAFAISNSSRCSTRSLGKYGARWDRCASRRRKKRDGASELAAERRERAQKAQPAHAIRGRSDVTPELIMLRDRKSTRLNSSHVKSSYAVFCLKKKNKDVK